VALAAWLSKGLGLPAGKIARLFAHWRAEHAIRPAVVTRKVWGGNRTWAAADTWQTLTSVLRTASQQGRDPIELLTRLLQTPVPIVADLAIPGPWSASRAHPQRRAKSIHCNTLLKAEAAGALRPTRRRNPPGGLTAHSSLSLWVVKSVNT
jgi:hypothetical protein